MGIYFLGNVSKILQHPKICIARGAPKCLTLPPRSPPFLEPLVLPSLVSRGIHVSDSGVLVKRAGPAAVAADAAAADADAEEA